MSKIKKMIENNEKIKNILTLRKEIVKILEDKTTTWEQKHHIIFYQENFKKQFEFLNNKNIEIPTSSNEVELLYFLNEITYKIKYTI